MTLFIARRNIRVLCGVKDFQAIPDSTALNFGLNDLPVELGIVRLVGVDPLLVSTANGRARPRLVTIVKNGLKRWDAKIVVRWQDACSGILSWKARG